MKKLIFVLGTVLLALMCSCGDNKTNSGSIVNGLGTVDTEVKYFNLGLPDDQITDIEIDGFSGPEPDFRWTIGKNQTIRLNMKSKEEITIKFRISAFLVDYGDKRRVTTTYGIKVNGIPYSTYNVGLDYVNFKDIYVNVNSSMLTPSGDIIIEFEQGDTCKPCEIIGGEDCRDLNLNIKDITVMGFSISKQENK